MKIPATIVPETKEEIDRIKEQADLYGLTFSEYVLYLIYSDGVDVFQSGD